MGTQDLWLKFEDLPDPTRLASDERWKDRLGVTGKQWGQYKQLTHDERALLAQIPPFLADVAHRGLLNPERGELAPRTFVSWLGKQLDGYLYDSGHRRATSFKGAFAVIEAYYRYRQWAMNFSITPGHNVRRLLELLIPYRHAYFGAGLGTAPGICRLTIELGQPEFACMGEFRYTQAMISLHEMGLTTDANRHPDTHMPRRIIDAGECFDEGIDFDEMLDTRECSSAQACFNPNEWSLISYLHRWLRAMCGYAKDCEGIFVTMPSVNVQALHMSNGETDAYIRVINPTAEQLQEFLDRLAWQTKEVFSPQGAQLQFDVLMDLSHIEVATFWSSSGLSVPDRRKEPLNEGDDVVPPQP